MFLVRRICCEGCKTCSVNHLYDLYLQGIILLDKFQVLNRNIEGYNFVLGADLLWRKLEADGAGPPPPYHHAITLFEHSKVLIFQGIGHQSRLNDIYILVPLRCEFLLFWRMTVRCRVISADVLRIFRIRDPAFTAIIPHCDNSLFSLADVSSPPSFPCLHFPPDEMDTR